MATTDRAPTSGSAQPWATGRHRHGRTAVPEQRSGTARESSDSAPPATSAAETRGRTEVAEQVVQKIAAAALGEIEEIGGPGRVPGVRIGTDDRPRVTATVHGADVDLQVRASVRYPAPVAEVVDRARARVTARITETTDLRVRRFDVTVTALPTATDPAGPVVR